MFGIPPKRVDPDQQPVSLWLCHELCSPFPGNKMGHNGTVAIGSLFSVQFQTAENTLPEWDVNHSKYFAKVCNSVTSDPL